MDVVTQAYGFLQEHQCNITVQVLFPVVLGMDDYFIQLGYFLCVPLISETSPREGEK